LFRSLRYTSTLLELENYRVETASSGEEAIERMNRGPAPNLLVLDLVLPGMDGLEILEKVKRAHPEQRILIISCLNDVGKVVQAIKLGASDYLTKPFQSSQFHGAVRRALDSDSQANAKAARYSVKDAEMV